MHGFSKARGFTLIELMVTIAVLSILMVLAVPTFTDFRQRAVLRGAADQVTSFWGDARFAALRENRLVRVSFVSDTGTGEACLGATTATSACNCLTAPATCTVGTYPASQDEWRRVRVPTPSTLGGGGTLATVIIDPKRGNITAPGDAGVISLQSPTGGSTDYRLNVVIDRNGRAFTCEPSTAPSKLPQFTERRC